jgi:hypothetical protein
LIYFFSSTFQSWPNFTPFHLILEHNLLLRMKSVVTYEDHPIIRSLYHKTCYGRNLRCNKLERLSLANLSSLVQCLWVRPEPFRVSNHSGAPPKITAVISFMIQAPEMDPLFIFISVAFCCVLFNLPLSSFSVSQKNRLRIHFKEFS